MPMLLITAVAKGWILGGFLCNLSGFLNTFLCSTSIWTLVMISINRFFAVKKATQFRIIFSERNTLYLIAFIWLLSFIIAFPPLIGWSEFVTGSNFCTINGKKHISYSIFVLFIDYLIPFFTLAGLYISIFFMLREQGNVSRGKNQHLKGIYQKESETKNTDNAILSSDNKPELKQSISSSTKNVISFYSRNLEDDINSTETNESISRNKVIQITCVNNEDDSPKREEFLNKISNVKRNLLREVRITKMLLMVVFTFFISWKPFIITSILYALSAVPEELRLITLGIMIACLNSVINPIIYAAMNKNFRESFKQLSNFAGKYGCT